MRRELQGLLLTIAIAPFSAASLPVHAQAKPLQVQESNAQGVNAELESAIVRDGVLTIKMRFRNTGSKEARVNLITHPSDVDKVYVVAGKTKLLPLRDSEHVPLMSALDIGGNITPNLQPGGSYLFWAKFPAPPAGTKVSVYTTQTPPFEDVPVTEAK